MTAPGSRRDSPERSSVVFLVNEVERARVFAGGLIGRSTACALYFADPEISEVHALVRERGPSLRLKGLAGPLLVRGTQCARVTLKPDLVITLATNVVLKVESVELSSTQLHLLGVTEHPFVLAEGHYSILPAGHFRHRSKGVKVEFGERLAIAATHDPEALAHIWSCGDGWSIRVRGCDPDLVRDGAVWVVGGERIKIRALPRAEAYESTRTYMPGKLVRVVVHDDRVDVFRADQLCAAFDGVKGAILRYLARLDPNALAYWVDIATSVYRRRFARSEDEYGKLQTNFYKHKREISRRLRDRGIREAIIRSNGKGEYRSLRGADITVEFRAKS